jgi:transcriptional regulator with XRE-family HTH domain
MSGAADRREARPFTSALGLWIRERRSDRRLSQKDLAQYAHISRSYLCDIEHGRGTQPSLQVIQNIARALGEDPAELVMHAGTDIDREEDLEPDSHRERRVLTIYRGLSPNAQESLERFARFLHTEEQRWVQPRLAPFATDTGPTGSG